VLVDRPILLHRTDRSRSCLVSSIEPYRHRPVARATARELAALDSRGSVQRARDLARAELAAARISDLTKVTRHGTAGAALIAYEAEVAAQMSPWASSQIAGVA